ncbi:MAG: biotin transporter BioY [Dorea sp.]|nr:biotin transporter BioY [Dorea sp.]
MKRKITTLEMVQCALFTALTAIGAFIQIPVPGMDYFTLQFFFVLMAGMLLGKSLGALAVGVYVLLGLAGLPIFAAGGGITYIFRPSFGYLVGFIVTAFVAGLVFEKVSLTGVKKGLVAAFAGLIVCYVIGLTYKYLMLNLYVGEKTALVMVLMDCFPIDLPGDIFLSIVAAICGSRLKPVLARINS